MKLPRVESLIISIFFLCIALWAISKCASKRDALPSLEPEPVEEPDTKSGAAQPTDAELPKLQNQPPPAAEPAPANTSTPATNTPVPGVIPKLSNETQTAPSQPAAESAAAEKYSTLFVTINNLKVRKEPNLKAPLVTRLKLDEQVFFLNEKSKEPQEINLGYETVTDYWVKIRTKSGKEGWAFGAGLHYYKMKRKGVLE